MQVGFQYYFVPNKVNLEGSRTVKGDMITVQNGKAVQVYKAKALTKEEVFAFYKPEIKPSITWWWILRFISSRFIICIRKAVFLTEGSEQNYSNYEGRCLFSYSNVANSLFRSFTSRENCVACNE